VELHIDSLERTTFRSHLTTSASLRGISTGSRTPPLKARAAWALGRRLCRHSRVRQASPPWPPPDRPVRAAIASKRDVTP